MELHELRQHWQQVAADTPAPLEAQELEFLMRAGRGPLGRLRRNAWWELGFTVVMLAAGVIGLLGVERTETRIMLSWLVLVCLVSLVSYHRHMLKGIQELSEVGGTMRAHLMQRLANVRRVMEASYRSVIGVLCITMGLNLGFSLYRVLNRHSGQALLVELGWLAAGWLVVGLIGYFGVRFLARQLLQHLYGRHLNHLEAALSELQGP